MTEAAMAFNTAPAADTKLELKGLSSGYGAIDVLQDVSFSIRSAEIFALMGKNGMGKTTLLKTILGLLPARRGSIELDGRPVTGIGPARLIASGIGYAPQEQPLFQDLSIRDNLRLALKSDRAMKDGFERAFSYFPFLAERRNQKAGTLSGGEQKMFILARALMLRPSLLLIDEISEGLQPSVVQRISAALKQERDQQGTTILLVEQNLDFALGLADHWAVLKRGSIDDAGEIEKGTRERILDHLKI
ncbi:ABC transporter ATP-binding protein [uncultured Roseibium sp.]|uniref:ABC transporter ATP-binding protein n=1 Tax=uncultured Roseibium sp. TaxID=1936171 RepID=UPI00321698CB